MTASIANDGQTTTTASIPFAAGISVTGLSQFPGSTRISSTGLLGIGMVPVNVLDITQTQNAASIISILNNSSGAAAQSEIILRNNLSSTGGFQFYGSGFTPSGLQRADGLRLTTNGAGGLTLDTGVVQPIYFGVNSSEVARLGTNSSFLLGKVAASLATAGVQANYSTGQTDITVSASVCLNMVRLTNNGTMVQFVHTDATTVIGSISTSGGTTTAYNTSSDIAFKENVKPAGNVGAIIDSAPVKSFDWKADKAISGSKPIPQTAGFVAQDLLDTVAPLVPGLVNQRDDGMLEYDPSKLVPLLWREVQSLRARLAVAGIP